MIVPRGLTVSKSDFTGRPDVDLSRALSWVSSLRGVASVGELTRAYAPGYPSVGAVRLSVPPILPASAWAGYRLNFASNRTSAPGNIFTSRSQSA